MNEEIDSAANESTAISLGESDGVDSGLTLGASFFRVKI